MGAYVDIVRAVLRSIEGLSKALVGPIMACEGLLRPITARKIQSKKPKKATKECHLTNLPSYRLRVGFYMFCIRLCKFQVFRGHMCKDVRGLHRFSSVCMIDQSFPDILYVGFVLC